MLQLGYQIEPEALDYLGGTRSFDEILTFLDQIIKEQKGEANSFIITLGLVKSVFPEQPENPNFDRDEFVDRSRVITDGSVLVNPTGKAESYIRLYKNRYDLMSALAKVHMDYKNVSSISSIGRLSKQKRGFKVAGLVLEKRANRNQTSLVIEDGTGWIRVASSGNIQQKIQDVLLDEYVILDVVGTEKGYVCNGLSHIDIPDSEQNRTTNDIYVLFISDLHFNSPYFDRKKWDTFVSWLRGNMGELNIVKKVKFVIIGGDLLDLRTSEFTGNTSIQQSYNSIADLISFLSGQAKVFIIPGECDATRIAIPQPAIPRTFAKRLYELENVSMLGNPSLISLNGVRVLVFHGQSLFDVKNQMRSYLNLRATDCMRALLKARHLAPTYGIETQIGVDNYDRLIIDEVPDIFFCGHLHERDQDNYKGVLLLSTPSWLKDSLVADVGGKAAVVNLRTFEVIWRA
jgi:DNA polymerase II small subunit